MWVAGGGMSTRVDASDSLQLNQRKIKPSTKSEYVAIEKFEQEAQPKATLNPSTPFSLKTLYTIFFTREI